MGSVTDPLIAQLVRRRCQAGLSQDAVAAAMHITQPALSKYENGHRTPSLALLRQWAEILDAPLTLLVLDEDGESDHDPEIPGQLRTPEQRRRRVLELGGRLGGQMGANPAEIAARVGMSQRSVYRIMAEA